LGDPALSGFQLMLKRLFPTLARMEPIELAVLPIAVIILMSGISGLAENVLWDHGYYDETFQQYAGVEHASDGWEP
jgi:hypothetical protein